MSFGLSLRRIKYFVSVPSWFFISGTDGQVCCTLIFPILVHPFLLGLCIPKFPYSFTVDVVFRLLHLDCIFLGVYASTVVWASVKFIFFCWFLPNKIRWVFECGHMVESFGCWYIVILICAGYLHSGANFWYFSTSGISWGCYSGVSSLIVAIFIFDIFPFSGYNCRNFTWLILLLFSISVFTCWISSGYPFSIVTLGGSEWVIVFFNWHDF